MPERASWLSITPEPERELPAVVATLERGARAGKGEVAREAARVERLVLRGSRRRWNRYLHRVVALIECRAQHPNADVAQARLLAARVIANHHNLLLALPGRSTWQTQTQRRALARLLASTNEDRP